MTTIKVHERIALAGLGALMVVVAVWYFVFWRTETSQLKAARASAAQAAALVASDQAQIASLKADAPQVAKEESVLRRLVEAVPNGPSLDQMLSTINSAASTAGVALTSVSTPAPSGWGGTASPGAPSTSVGPSYMTLSVGVTGPEARILAFVSALDHEPRLYVVDSFGLSSPGAGARNYSSTLTVQGFFQSAASQNPTFPGN